MQVSVESTGALTRKLTIAVPAAEFEGQVAQRVKSTAGKVSLPGFRRGHVPLKEVERRYGASLRREVATEVVQSRLPDALREQDVPIIGTPSVELVNIERGADLLFTASFEVLPDIDLVDLTTLTVMKPVAEITEADIDDMVETLRRQRVEWIPVERPAQADDRVVVDVSVRIEGKEVSPDGQEEDVTFVVGDGQATAELDAAVVGMTVGENRVYPVRIQRVTDDSSSVPSAVGEVRMKRVEAPRLPELDDAFFAFFGVDDGESPAAPMRTKRRPETTKTTPSMAAPTSTGRTASTGMPKLKATGRLAPGRNWRSSGTACGNGCLPNSTWRRAARPDARSCPS